MDISSKSLRYENSEVEIIPVREKMISDVISNISCVVFICLRLLREAIKQTMAAEGNACFCCMFAFVDLLPVLDLNKID